jgi:RNA polymerase sigma-70 factor (ECF subfamily)
VLRPLLLRAGDEGVSGPASPAVIRELEARLRPFVARRVPAPDVDDVLQDVLLRLHRGAAEIRDDERLAPWLFQVARNVIVDHRRARVRHPIAEAHDRPEEPAEADASRDAVEAELAGCVGALVAELPSPYREAITLVELEGRSQKDAASALGLSHSGMKSRVQRGRAMLRDGLERACAVELDARRGVVDCAPRASCACGAGPGRTPIASS